MNGLILIGGKSSRMGTDKSMLYYHGISQRAYLYDLLKKFCAEVYFSCRKEQLTSEPCIVDYLAISPISGILSAFEFDSQTAWLVIACDMPLVNAESLQVLVENRNTEKIATAYLNPVTNAPEPLITIYEPDAYGLLKAFVELGNKSPKVFLQCHAIELIKAENTDFLTNVNTREDLDNFKLTIKA